jgi:hypothetical protein
MAGVEPAGGVDHGTDQRRRVIAANAAWEFACGTGSGQGQPPVAAADACAAPLRCCHETAGRSCRSPRLPPRRSSPLRHQGAGPEAHVLHTPRAGQHKRPSIRASRRFSTDLPQRKCVASASYPHRRAGHLPAGPVGDRRLAADATSQVREASTSFVAATQILEHLGCSRIVRSRSLLRLIRGQPGHGAHSACWL